MKSPLLSLLVLGSLLSASPALAQYDQTLSNQREQIQELNQQLRIQANQRQIERLQQQVINGYGAQPNQNQNQQPPVVVVEQKQPSGIGVLLGTVVGAALSNGYVNCGPNGNCGYGYGGGGYRGGYYGNPGRCAVRTGYRGCNWKLPVTTTDEIDIKSLQQQINSIPRPQEPVNDLERYLGNVNFNCGNSYAGCAAGYRGIMW